MARISIKNVSNAFMAVKKKDDALKKLQEQMNSVRDAQREQTNIIVNKSTKFILEKTRLGLYLRDIVSKTLETGDGAEYDTKLSLIVEGISKVVEEVSNMAGEPNVKDDSNVVKEENTIIESEDSPSDTVEEQDIEELEDEKSQLDEVEKPSESKHLSNDRYDSLDNEPEPDDDSGF